MAGPNHTGSKPMFITVPLPTRFLPSACGPLAVLSLGEPTLSANPHHSVQNTGQSAQQAALS